MLYFALGAKRKKDLAAIATCDTAYAAESREAALAKAEAAGAKYSRWICRGTGDIPNWPAACELAALLGVTPGEGQETTWLEVDSGPNVSPRYDVMIAPKVGDVVSYGFNGDYYPAGSITKVSDSKRRVEATGEDGRVRVFWRLRNTAVWKFDSTWSMCGGRHDERNPSF